MNQQRTKTGRIKESLTKTGRIKESLYNKINHVAFWNIPSDCSLEDFTHNVLGDSPTLSIEMFVGVAYVEFAKHEAAFKAVTHWHERKILPDDTHPILTSFHGQDSAGAEIVINLPDIVLQEQSFSWDYNDAQQEWEAHEVKVPTRERAPEVMCWLPAEVEVSQDKNLPKAWQGLTNEAVVLYVTKSTCLGPSDKEGTLLCIQFISPGEADVGKQFLVGTEISGAAFDDDWAEWANRARWARQARQ